MGVKKKTEKRMGGEAAATKSISSPASAACFLTTRTQAHTRTYSLVWCGGAHQPDNKETHRGGSHTAARTASHITGVQCQGH